MYLYIYLCIYPSISLFIYPFIYLSIWLSNYHLIDIYIRLFIYQLVYLFIYLTVCRFICLIICLFMYVSIYPTIHLFLYVAVLLNLGSKSSSANENQAVGCKPVQDVVPSCNRFITLHTVQTISEDIIDDCLEHIIYLFPYIHDSLLVSFFFGSFNKPFKWQFARQNT